MKIKQKKLGEKGGDNTKGWSSRVQRFEEEGRKGLDFKGHTHIFFGTGVKISRLPRRFFFFFFFLPSRVWSPIDQPRTFLRCVTIPQINNKTRREKESEWEFQEQVVRMRKREKERERERGWKKRTKKKDKEKETGARERERGEISRRKSGSAFFRLSRRETKNKFLGEE